MYLYMYIFQSKTKGSVHKFWEGVKDYPEFNSLLKVKKSILGTLYQALHGHRMFGLMAIGKIGMDMIKDQIQVLMRRNCDWI